VVGNLENGPQPSRGWPGAGQLQRFYPRYVSATGSVLTGDPTPRPGDVVHLRSVSAPSPRRLPWPRSSADRPCQGRDCPEATLLHLDWSEGRSPGSVGSLPGGHGGATLGFASGLPHTWRNRREGSSGGSWRPGCARWSGGGVRVTASHPLARPCGWHGRGTAGSCRRLLALLASSGISFPRWPQPLWIMAALAERLAAHPTDREGQQQPGCWRPCLSHRGKRVALGVFRVPCFIRQQLHQRLAAGEKTLHGFKARLQEQQQKRQQTSQGRGNPGKEYLREHVLKWLRFCGRPQPDRFIHDRRADSLVHRTDQVPPRRLEDTRLRQALRHCEGPRPGETPRIYQLNPTRTWNLPADPWPRKKEHYQKATSLREALKRDPRSARFYAQLGSPVPGSGCVRRRVAGPQGPPPDDAATEPRTQID